MKHLLDIEWKGFWTIVVGTVTQWAASATALQVIGFLVAVSGLIVQVSAFMKNRAETKRHEAQALVELERNEREKREHAMRMARYKSRSGDSDFGEITG